VTRRRDSVVGVDQYANAQEKPLDQPPVDQTAFQRRRVHQVVAHRTTLEDDENALVLQRLAKIIGFQGPGLVETCVDAATAGATLGEITRAVRINDTPCTPITPVCITRAAMRVEALRNDVQRHVASGAEQPKVFLCNMGPLKDHKARADFSRGFFSVGGYTVVSPPAFKSIEDCAAAFGASGARIAVICSTDENYPALVPPLVKALRGKCQDAICVVAGYPQEQVETYKSAGIDEFIHMRADVVEVLTGMHAKLGIS
jgi:methylmalonyl-CoA mutase